VPDPPIRIPIVRQSLGQHEMGGLALREGCVLVDRGADERVAELDSLSREANEPGRFAVLEGGGLEAEDAGRSLDELEVARALGRGDEQKLLRLFGQEDHTSEEGFLEAVGQRDRIRDRCSAGELIGVEGER
jgi:hypothetical protein